MDECERLKAKVKGMIEGAQITDADNFGDGSLYEVWLSADLFDEIREAVGADDPGWA